MSHAQSAGSKVSISYVSFQGSSCMTKSEALRYLEHLDGGGVLRHWDAFRGNQS